MSDNEERPGLHVPERWIPVPTTISPGAQASLAAPLFMKRPDDEPDPADKQAWREYVSERNGLMSMFIRAMLPEPCEFTAHSWNGVTVYEVVPPVLADKYRDKAIYCMHGGAFVLGGGEGAAYQAMALAIKSQIRVFTVDYRMPPDHPFPAGLNDSVAAYRVLLERYDARDVAVYGPSAGSGMAGSCLLKARDQGLPLPAACVLSSPEIDLTESGDTFETNLGIDRMIGRLTNSIALYADGHDLRDPYLSPLFGDFAKGFPPTILTTGTRDLFLSNAVLMHRALRRADIEAELHVFEARSHGGFFGMPDDDEVFDEEMGFIRKHLNR